MNPLVLLPLQHQKTISQERLKPLALLYNDLKKVKKIFRENAKPILAELISGAEVEDGDHIAQIKIKQKGDKIKYKLKVR